jgi:UDP-N-acetylmuramate dehydrogenase
VRNNYYGSENLSLIPGKIGGSVVQNIGAYGMEIKDILYSVEYIDIKDKKTHTIFNKDCQFSYRSSIFKTTLKNCFIFNVVFKLSLKEKYVLEYINLKNPNLKKIRNNILKIRKNKLPDPKQIGNAGSFFKNPIISKTKLNKIIKKYPTIPYFKTDNGYKIPTA